MTHDTNMPNMLRATVVTLALTSTGVAACQGKPPSDATPPPAPPTLNTQQTTREEARVIHSLIVKSLDGKDVALSSFAGKVVLVVNTASECGYTPQYEGLEKLHEKYASRGFAVLGFPSNDFGGQEPGTSEQIATFCKSKYGVTFPMFDKVKTKGTDRAPLYALLSDAKGEPRWNFHKYLVDKKGQPVEAWPSAVEPSSAEIARAIERELGKP